MKTLKFCTLVHEYSNLSELGEVDLKLVQKALESAEKSYSPYSNFRVGVSVLLDNDKIICGNNQENSAYPSGLCAERVAIFYANAKFPKNRIISMAIVAKINEKITDQPVYPCGSCRQVMVESETRFHSPIKLILPGNDYIHVLENVSQLLPQGFDKRLLPEK
jgi:cytidine deaminase